MTLNFARKGFAEIRRIISPFCESVELYGSAARGSENPGDIDIFIQTITPKALRHTILLHAWIGASLQMPAQPDQAAILLWRCTWPGIGRVDFFIRCIGRYPACKN